MPNYVTNKIYIDAYGDKLNEILEAVKRDGGELGTFDFNKLIPQPESLNMVCGSLTDLSIAARLYQLKHDSLYSPEEYESALDAVNQMRSLTRMNTKMPLDEIMTGADRHNKTLEELYDLGKQYIENQKQYGAATWWEWRIENWGTKWNAPDHVVIDDMDDQCLYFDTAWSAPFPIVEALSEKFPDVRFAIEWADEDLGHNVGAIAYLQGMIIDMHTPVPGSKEAYDMAFGIKDTSPEECCLRYDEASGSYVYDDSLDTYPVESKSLEDKIALADEKRQAQTQPSTDLAPKEPTR